MSVPACPVDSLLGPPKLLPHPAKKITATAVTKAAIEAPRSEDLNAFIS